MALSRRSFLSSTVVCSAGFLGLHRLVTAFAEGDLPTPNTKLFGKLIPDPEKVMDLPEGFRYRVISKVGNAMSDGLLVPGSPDGMAAFPGPDGLTLVVRNHELTPDAKSRGPFGKDNKSFSKIDANKVYDVGENKTPSVGGTTTMVFDTKKQQLVREYLSLAGTQRNCAGGPTPWGTWLTCEETVTRMGPTKVKVKDKVRIAYHSSKEHGYVFEVTPSGEVDVSDPVPLEAMGRFNHEAVAVDPKTDIVYLTEDRGDGLFYRFLPNKRKDLKAGGKLQALVVVDRPSLKTGNGKKDKAKVEIGKPMAVRWLDLDDVKAPKDDLRARGFKAGAAQFVRGEGIWTGTDGIYFACTTGGPKEFGQVWRYVPSKSEGTSSEAKEPGQLTLFAESQSDTLLRNCDNLTIAPWDDILLCEDRIKGTPHRIVGITPAGEYYHLGAHPSSSELAGACFSPDGSTLFVNIQKKGLTLAITGPFTKRG